MNKIDKFLKRLSKKERQRVLETLEQILAGDLQGLDVKKLRGHQYYFRVRVGDLRIIYSQKNDDVRIVAIQRRNEKTYRDF